MNEIDELKPKRKVLSLKLDRPEAKKQPRYLDKREAIFMVWGEYCPMPNRVYRKHEQNLAVHHAKLLCDETGRRFYVMRAWRAFDPS